MNAMTPGTPSAAEAHGPLPATAPRIEDSLVRIPDGQEVPQPPEEAAPAPRPWYRRWYVITAAIAMVLGALAVVLSLTVLANNPPSGMAGVLARDGYPVTATFTKDQMDQLGAFSGTDGAAMRPFVTGAALGVKNGREKIVIQFTPDYGAIMRAGLPSHMSALGLPPDVTAHMAGNDLVYAGPVSVLGLPPGVSAS
jgi:hypothetical protein